MSDPIVAALAERLERIAVETGQHGPTMLARLRAEGLVLVSTERLAKLEKVAEAARRLAKVLGLASSVHTSERRAARIAFHAAFAALDEEEEA